MGEFDKIANQLEELLLAVKKPNKLKPKRQFIPIVNVYIICDQDMKQPIILGLDTITKRNKNLRRSRT